MSLGFEELFIILLYPLLLVLVGFGLYWVVRLAVRHGIRDADARRSADQAGPPIR